MIGFRKCKLPSNDLITDWLWWGADGGGIRYVGDEDTHVDEREMMFKRLDFIGYGLHLDSIHYQQSRDPFLRCETDKHLYVNP